MNRDLARVAIEAMRSPYATTVAAGVAALINREGGPRTPEQRAQEVFWP